MGNTTAKMEQGNRIKAVAGYLLSYIASVFDISVDRNKITNPLPEIHTLIKKEDSDMYRWSIGISDISATTSIYDTEGELISTVYTIDYPIDNITLYTNHEFNGGSIEYYIIPDGGSPYRINPWEDKDIKLENGRFIPKTLYVNSEIPKDRRDSSTWGEYAYIDTPTPLYGFRLRALLIRGDNPNRSPFIRDYKIRVTPKDIGGIVERVSR